MENLSAPSPCRISSSEALDALVGRHITNEEPRVLWMDSNALLRFDSRAEAIAVVGKSPYRAFLPDHAWESSVVHKVERYRAYSTDEKLAWKMAEKMERASDFPLRVTCRRGTWSASFGAASPARARTSAIALCLAALKVRGISAVLEEPFASRA